MNCFVTGFFLVLTYSFSNYFWCSVLLIFQSYQCSQSKYVQFRYRLNKGVGCVFVFIFSQVNVDVKTCLRTCLLLFLALLIHCYASCVTTTNQISKLLAGTHHSNKAQASLIIALLYSTTSGQNLNSVPFK